MNKFCREFYGYIDKSNKGQYTYHRKGFMDKFNYIKPLRGVIVVKEEDTNEILLFLKKYNAEIFYRKILLTKEDMKILSVK